MFDAVEDADGAEDVPFDELVAMQGPVFRLLENAIMVRGSLCRSCIAIGFSVSEIAIE
jgi:hypothetical protein